LDSHLTIAYRHNRVTGEPLFAGNQIAQCVAHDVRQQLTRGDDRVLAIDLERLTRVRTMRVNNITYEVEWSTDAPVSDDRGKPVLGVCEFDPDGLPDTALICVNPNPVEGRTELLLSTGAHEMGHGIFEAPAWICAHQRRSMPTLFDVAEPMIGPAGYRSCLARSQPIVRNQIRPLLRLAEVLEPDHRHLGEPELPRRKQPSMAGQDPGVLVDQDRIGPAEFDHRRRDLIHLRVAVGARIPLIRP
jgi:hypothetical protein